MRAQLGLDHMHAIMPLADLLVLRRAQVGAYYAGVGSRETPEDILVLITRIARKLGSLGWTLRSGGADGADTAFEIGSPRKAIYLPWPCFNGRTCDHVPLSGRAFEISEQHLRRSSWEIRNSVKRLMARNVYQILGTDCASPSAFVLCWTPDGATDKTTSYTGGTGQAIRIANAYGVPVFNLQRADHRAEWERFVA